MASAPTPGSLPTARDNEATLYTTNPSLFDENVVRYDYAETDETLWNKSFPYQLVILKVNSNQGKPLEVGLAPAPTYSVYNNLFFTLPINPESLSTSTPFAMTLAATVGGVVEQNGGAPFRFLQFSGSLGVVSERPAAYELQGGRLGGALGEAAGIFAGTIQATNALRSAATALGSGERYNANLSSETPGDEVGDIATHSTGYWQLQTLKRFLESYAEAKKTTEGRDLRLALMVWKENAAYIVTPLSFDVAQTAQSPWEYRYSFRLQAWRRVDSRDILGAQCGSVSPYMTGATSFTLARAYTLVSNCIKTAQAVKNVLRAVRKDTTKVFDTYRQVALFCASAGGLVRSALSFPSSLRKSLEPSTRESWDRVKQSSDNLDPKLKSRVDQITTEVSSYRSGISTTTPTLSAMLADDDQSDFHEFIRPDSLNMSPNVRAGLQDHIDQTATLTSDDFRTIADTAFSVVADYADAVGLSSTTYDTVTGRTPKTKIRDATYDDYRALHSLSAAAQAIQSLVINAPSRTPITTIEYVAGLANANGLSMRVPRSKFAVPFPYGGTLEELAQQYLGDTSRWMEIAELNDLVAPYVDEVGTTQVLATNGTGNLINMTDASRLTLGQYVRIWSNTVIPEKRQVMAVRSISATQWQVTLDGDNDLAKLKTVDGASIQWFTVGTVNSQQVLYIPSDSPSNPDIVKYVPQESDFNRILTVGDIDGMLSESGDLVITPDGDWPTVFGYAYLVQWARVALMTPIRSLSLHADFGLDAQVGQNLADSSAQDVLKSVTSIFRFNPSFAGVSAATVQRNGPTTQISLELGVRGLDAYLPLTFDVKS